MPADSETVVLYIEDLSAVYGVAKITRHMSAISLAHLLAGFKSPGEMTAVRGILAKLRRKGDTQSSPKLMLAPNLKSATLLKDFPPKATREYPAGQIIFEEGGESSGMYLVIKGRVSVVRTAQERQRMIIGIFAEGQIFSSAAFLGWAAENEKAEALERTVLLAWGAEETESYIVRHPKIAATLMRILVRPYLDCAERLQNIAMQKTTDRIGWALLRFAQSQGNQLLDDGAVRIPPMTHDLISDYVGTTREIVTLNMNQFRQQGLIRYSRKCIDIRCDALQEYLRQRDLARTSSSQAESDPALKIMQLQQGHAHGIDVVLGLLGSR